MVGGAGVFFWNSRILCVIEGGGGGGAKRPKLVILNSLSSPSPFGGSLSGDDTRLGNSRIPSDFC